MRLSDDVNTVDLRPLRYQFPGARGDVHDDNWLVIAGSVTTPEGSWSFADPCLLTDEAREVAAWLRSVAAGTVAVAGRNAEGEPAPSTWFIEPVLAFSLADRSETGAVLRVHLSLEAAPPWRQAGQCAGEAHLHQYVVEVRLEEAALLRAADAWDRALASFPTR